MNVLSQQKNAKRLPEWLRRSLPATSTAGTQRILNRYRLKTVCQEARCPNQSECFSCRTATVMILGDVCTRRCSFCSVSSGCPEPPSADEPLGVAMAVKELGLKYVVITSVTRDDLQDEGAGHFADVVYRLHESNPGISVEVLTPDFHNRIECIRTVVATRPVVYNHNVEVVERLQRFMRPQADYGRSLGVLETVKNLDPQLVTKSGLMLGLGETEDEVRNAVRDLRSVGCDIVTLGQYLPPSSQHVPVREFISPQVFDQLAEEFKVFGFKQVFSGPYVRSSYHAKEAFCESA